ncbi:MAG: CoA transferase, partial [Acidimicrobiales bacterium]
GSSASGSCRLVRAGDGWLAVNLARPEDRAAVAAVTEGEVQGDPWTTLEGAARRRSVSDLVGRARLLGVAAAPIGRPDTDGTAEPSASTRLWPRAGADHRAEVRVVDLSSMWAGPLCTALLARAGFRVTKVESSSRPDGVREVPDFYRTLHAADQEVATLDFSQADGRRRLRALIEEADVVVESSRPRALAQLGLAPDTVDGPPGKVWVSITGYGRRPPGAGWVAFGDDAAVAGGLVAWEDTEHPVFCGDALADPVTGMTAAAAALRAVAAGGGVLLDVSMQACAAALMTRAPVVASPARRCGNRWCVTVGRETVPVRDRAERL